MCIYMYKGLSPRYELVDMWHHILHDFVSLVGFLEFRINFVSLHWW